MSKLINRIATVAALALAATPIVGLASAAHAAEPVARIKIGDLRLSNPADAAEFALRAKAAGGELCAQRRTKERLGLLSSRACMMDFNEAVNAELSRAQRADLRIAARADATQLASR